MTPTPDPAQLARSLYLALIERCLLNVLYREESVASRNGDVEKPDDATRGPHDNAHTEIGHERLRNLLELAEQILAQNVPGDFLEIGVGRGGGCILLRAVLKAYNTTDRRVFCADSFPGAKRSGTNPSPDETEPSEVRTAEAEASVEQVKANLEKYALLDEQIVFLDGRLQESLPVVPTSSLALLRIQVAGRRNRSAESLCLVYYKVSPKGFVIVDSSSEADLRAVDDFRSERSTTGPLFDIEGKAVYWRKTTESPVTAPAVHRMAPIPAGRKRPFWTVIVPIFKRREYLKQCLDSVLDQDPGPDEMEINVVDDASPGDMRQFVLGLGRGRVNYSRNPTNLRQHATTNLAITQSCGRWIHILHDDDWVLPILRHAEAGRRDGAGFHGRRLLHVFDRQRGEWSVTYHSPSPSAKARD